MSDKNDIIEKLRSVKKILAEEYQITGVALFGSATKEKLSHESDIDVLVDFNDRATLLDLVGAADFLEGLLGRKVDIVPRRALRKELREQIISEAIIV